MAKKKRGELPSGKIRRQVLISSTPVFDSAGKPVLNSNGKQKIHRQYVSIVADSVKEADYMAAELKLDKKKSVKENTTTFIAAVDAYLSIKEPVLSPSTYRGYHNIKKGLLNLNRDFCIKKLSDIDDDDIQKVINNISASHSPKTVRNYNGFISAVLKHAKWTSKLNTSLPQAIPSNLYIPTDVDIKKLMDSISGKSLEIPVLLGAFCMMRRGEICGLSISDLSDENILHIHTSRVAGVGEVLHDRTTKNTTSDRFIEVPDFIADKIRKQGYITSLKPNTITKEFGKQLQKIGIPHFRFHDLRHYSASIRHALGIPDAYIMSDGGWKTDHVLKNIYRHALDDQRKHFSSVANNHFSNICNTECNTTPVKGA